MGYLSKDGQFYDTFNEMCGADKRYMQQEMQSKMLYEQNKLMIEQLEEDKKRRAQEAEQEYQRQKHEKEMRILKLFDEVSIPFNIYKDFEDYLLNATDMDFGEENQEHIKKFTELTEEMSSLTAQHNENIDNIQKVVFSNDDTAISNKKVKYSEKYKKFEDFVNDKIKIDDLPVENWNTFDNDNEIQTLLKQFKKQKDIKKKAISKFKDQNTKKFIIGILIALFIVCIWANITILLISCLAIMILSFYFSKQVKIYELKKQLNKSINLKMVEEVKIDSEARKKVDAIMKQCEGINQKLEPLEIIILEKKMNLFNKFRFSHYNMKMEKLFVDVGLVEKCKENNVQFDIIDKNKISAEGTFEDYFHFFQNFENIYLADTKNEK